MKVNKQATTANLIAQLNPVIRGWANYHRHVVSKATFYHVDTVIFNILWSWAKRRHPQQSRWWVAENDPEGDLTLSVLALTTQLLNLQKSADEIPSSRTIRLVR